MTRHLSEATEWIPCGRGICAAEEGHDGTCDEASGWDEFPLPERINQYPADLDEETEMRL